MTTTPDYEGFRAAALKRFPRNIKEINTFIEGKQREELGRRGVLDVEDIAKTDPGSALRLSQEGIKSKVEEGTGVEFKKLRNLGESGLRTAEQVKSIYERDPTVLTKQKIPGRFFSRDFDNALFNTVDSLLRIRTGAAAPEEEVRRYMASIGPNFGDSPQVVEQKLNNLIADLSSAAGRESSDIKVSPVPQGSAQSVLELLDLLIPGSKKRAGRISAAGKAGDLGRAANIAFNPLESPENIQSAASVAGYTILPKILSKTVGKFMGGLPWLNKGATAKAAKAAGTLDTKIIVRAGDKFVTHEPMAKELWDVVKPTIQNKTQAPDLMEKMYDVWKRAYNVKGDVKGNAEAQLYNKLYGAGRKIIEEQAPKLSKEISKLKFLHELPKKAQQVSWFALKGTAIGKMLGL